LLWERRDTRARGSPSMVGVRRSVRRWLLLMVARFLIRLIGRLLVSVVLL
jgi:hypothetical protein